MRIPFPSFSLALTAAIPVLTQTPAAAAPVDRPNVILILADDMAIGDIAAFNGGVSRTPNIDRLLTDSVYFEHAYSAAPVSAPSRAGLLTGRYPHRTGCVTLEVARFPTLTRIKQGIPTMADIFRDNGYVTGLIGKWHCGEGEGYEPLSRGFDEFEGFIAVLKSYFNYSLNIQGKKEKFDGLYLTENLSARALEFVRRHKDKPFFLHLAQYAPHRPLNAPEALVDYYLSKGLNKENATIYAMVEVLDQGVGQLMDELDKLGLRENTIVIFSSDNGPDPLTGERFNLSQRGMKYDVFEGGIHVPFIVHYPGKVKNGVCPELVHFTDVLPTLAQLCALTLSPKQSENLDGGSFAPLLLGEKAALPAQRVWQWNRGVPDYTQNAAIREGQWKLVRPPVSRNFPTGPSTLSALLFNVKDDPSEQNDVAVKNPQVVQTLQVLLEQQCRQLEFDRLSP